MVQGKKESGSPIGLVLCTVSQKQLERECHMLRYMCSKLNSPVLVWSQRLLTIILKKKISFDYWKHRAITVDALEC